MVTIVAGKIIMKSPEMAKLSM